MNYEGDQFLRLLVSVQDQGGALLPDKCKPSVFRLKIDGKWKDVDTTGCDQEARIAVPYDPTEPVDVPPTAFKRMDGKKVTFRGSKHPGEDGETMRGRGGGIVTACAVDDDMGRWPRFAKSMQEGT